MVIGQPSPSLGRPTGSLRMLRCIERAHLGGYRMSYSRVKNKGVSKGVSGCCWLKQLPSRLAIAVARKTSYHTPLSLWSSSHPGCFQSRHIRYKNGLQGIFPLNAMTQTSSDLKMNNDALTVGQPVSWATCWCRPHDRQSISSAR